ncbi:Spy0128 family protein [Microbacterium tumbae]
MSVLLTAALIAAASITGGVVSAPSARADEPTPFPVSGGETPVEKVRDTASFHDYPGVQADDEDIYTVSLDPGRIWVDKTVFKDDADLAGQGNPDDPMTLHTDEFSVVLSALGSTRQISSTRSISIDLALILDNSTSMTQCVQAGASSDGYCNDPGNWQQSRAFAMAQGVNTAIRTIVCADPSARIGIVQFGNDSGVVHALGTPTAVPGSASAACEPGDAPTPTTYVTLSAPGSANGNMTLRVGTGSLTVGSAGGVSQSTNIQRGIATGMGLLTSPPAGTGVTGDTQRIPSVIVFTDGEPTYSATSATWWAPGPSGGNQGPQVPGQNQYYGNGFKAAMTAAYYKNRIDDVYNDEAYNSANGLEDVKALVYTVGLGIDSLTANGRNLALATLDPKTNLGSTANSMFQGFTNAFATYSSGSSASVPINGANSNPNQFFTVTHPTAPNNAYDVTDLRYNESFSPAASTEQLIEIFEGLANQIIQNKPVLPIDVESPNPNADGYVTFTDPLGDFMRVTDVPRITYCQVDRGTRDQDDCEPYTFETQVPGSPFVNGNVSQYVFEGSFDANDLFPETPLSNIIITVERNPALAVGDKVTVRIPVSLLPMRDTHVVEDASGDPVSMTWTAQHPVHVYYDAAPKAGVADAVADPSVIDGINGNAYGDKERLAQYVAANSADGRVRFYTNDYESVDGADVASSAATFQPAESNDYYLYGYDTSLWQNETCTDPLTQSEWNAIVSPGAMANAPVFHCYPRYTLNGDDTVTKDHLPLRTSKRALLDGEYGTITVAAYPAGHPMAGQMHAPEGLYDMTLRPHALDTEKCAEGGITWPQEANNSPVCTDPGGNLTDTDQWSHLTALSPGTTPGVRVRLGNNGWLSYAVPGTLRISKVVDHPAGLSPDASTLFTFRVSLTSGGEPVAGAFETTINGVDGTTRTDTISDGGTLQLRDGEAALVQGLPAGTTYTVTEESPPPGYAPGTVTPADGTGTITTPQTTTPAVEFRNVYSADPATVEDAPSATKSLTGRDWLDGEAFPFRLCPAGEAPDPAAPAPPGTGPDPATGCVTVSATEDDPTVAFPGATFTTPGVYDYRIFEPEGAAAGMTYSHAEYIWRVDVRDNGEGALEVFSTQLLRAVEDDGTAATPPAPVTDPQGAVFGNAFTAGDFQRPLRIVKLVEDHSLTAPGQLRPPIADYTFRFAVVDPQPETGAPLFGADPPATSGTTTVDVVSTSGSSSIVSPPLTFSADDAGRTFYYTAEEVPEGGAPGVDYSEDKWFFRTQVVIDDTDPENVIVEPVVTYCLTTIADSSGPSPDAPWGACDPDSGEYLGLAEIDGTPALLNTLDPLPTTAVELPFSKALTGRAMTAADAFVFDLAPASAATETAMANGWITMPADTAATVTGPADAGVQTTGAFDGITFAKQGLYSFRITERDTGQNGIAYDAHALIYDVRVVDQLDDDRLDAVVTIRGAADPAPASADDFVNAYQGSALYAGAELYKVLAGRDQREGEFLFDVTVDEALQAKLGWGSPTFTLANPDTATAGQSLLVARLEGMTFTQADIGQEFRATIVEREGTAPRVSYDATVYDAYITPRFDPDADLLYTLTRVEADGTEVASYDSRDDDAPTIRFDNAYTPAATTADIPLLKGLAGDQWTGRSFQFRLTPVGDAGSVPMPPAGDTVTIDDESAVAADQARIGAFEDIPFTAAGVYAYEIRELVPDPADPVVAYDAQVKTITVTVTDDGDGSLHADVASDSGQRFDNAVRREFRTLVYKHFDDQAISDSQFWFNVRGLDEASAAMGGIPYPEGVDLATSSTPPGQPSLMATGGDTNFTVDAAGQTFCYAYTEIAPPGGADPAVVYDDREFTICVTPEFDADGFLSATSVITGSDGSETTSTWYENQAGSAWPEIHFDNRSVPDLEMDKTAAGLPAVGYTIGGEFEYDLTVTNRGAGPAFAPAITDDVPTTLEVVDVAVPDGWTDQSSGNSVRATGERLAPGQSTTVTIRVRVLSGGADIANLACVSAPDDADPANDCDSVSVPPSPGLATTGGAPMLPWIAAALLLIAIGILITILRRRRRGGPED